MSWSGGKDSAVALYELLNTNAYDMVALLTTVSEEYRRISHHGVREVLLEQQADAIGIPLDKVYLPSNSGHPCRNDVYEQIMGDVMARYKACGVETVGFGDLFLEDLRAYRERNLAKAGMRGVFPIWKRDTTKLAREVIAMGFKSYLSCVEGKVGPGFAGRPYDEELLASLPAGIDPCGEYGEFHTFVYDGPVFKRPVPVMVGKIVIRDGRYYADLIPAAMDVPAACDADMPPV
ncbi:MAG: adenine nucleotide alpha hydrolase [Acidobacteria bacterium]|nr:adenine nucleotide alpha hydrolase [Acidobacteriota bacterium]